MLDSEAWGRPRDAGRYPGRTGFTEYCLDLYYRYLNLGFRLVPTGGSASGVLPNPLGYNRVYAPIEGEFAPSAFFAALRRGETLVTNGPILWFETEARKGGLHVTVRAEAREPIDRIEIVANGGVVKRFDASSGEFTLDPSRHTWVAARCFLKSDDTIRFAHTSPVWLDGEWDASGDARFFLTWLDELIAQTAAEPDRYSSATQQKELLDLYRQARAVYENKLARR